MRIAFFTRASPNMQRALRCSSIIETSSDLLRKSSKIRKISENVRNRSYNLCSTRYLTRSLHFKRHLPYALF